MPPTATQNPQSPTKGVALKEHLVGGKANEIQGAVQSVTTVSYFKGNDPSKWKSNISTYEVVDMGEVYDGIGLRLKAYSNNVEKLFTVTPDASPEAIKVGLSGATALKVNEDGQLEAETELGPVTFTKPVAYQEIDGKRVEVAVEYKIHGAKGEEGSEVGEHGCRGEPEIRNSKSETENPKSEIRNSKLTYGFIVASYDKTQDLIIDPLLASTFLGGSDGEYSCSLVLDTSGNVYVTGWTSSTDFPTTSGAYDTSYNSDYYNVHNIGDVFVSKLNSGLTSLLASTYLGGSGSEVGYALTLDTSGNVYVTGYTWSTDFPTTSGAYDTSFNVNNDWRIGDVFVSKLDSGLTSLLASTYLGGNHYDVGESLALDTSGNVYVTGGTWSTDFPTTSGAYDTSYYYDWTVFVSKLDSGLTSLLASTYLGWSSYSRFLTLDTSGNVYVTGNTWSAAFPTTIGAYDTTHNSASDTSDVFVAKLNSGLTSLLASTFLGGLFEDIGYALILDTSGNVYVTGETDSTDFPTTSGAYDTSYDVGNAQYVNDVFVSKLDSELTSLLASTYLGGASWDYGRSLTLDTSGNVYVTGGTDSTDFPTTSGAYDTSYDGGAYDYYDVYISKLNSGLTSLLASTFLGGSEGEGYEYVSLALDTSGNVYVTGLTVSSDFPTTSGAYDTSLNGNFADAFISILDGNLSGNITCTYSLSSTSQSFSAGGGTGSVGVTASSGSCSWTAVSNAAWITITNGSSGTGNGTVDYGVSVNTGTSARTGTMTIAGDTFTVIERGAVRCRANSITAVPNRLTLRYNGNGNVTITVKGTGNCPIKGVTVTATINGTGSSLIAVSPVSQKTDANGQAVFAIDANDVNGKASVNFNASGLSKFAIVRVTVR